MAVTPQPVLYNNDKWIVENEQYFLPPVCNKMMHNKGQLKVFFVGGPNQRKDYHIEEGEELFYMVKGDMCLKVVEQNKHKDVHIKEGEIFLLPARIPHSPQRLANTIGLVLERERDPAERDGLRYFQEKEYRKTLDSLYEEWFHCTDLGTQLGPVIKRYFASEQCATGKPIPGTIPENPPVTLNEEIRLQDPFNLHEWIEKNRTEIDTKGFIQLFGDSYQFVVRIYGKGENDGGSDRAETWILQIAQRSVLAERPKVGPVIGSISAGESTVTVDNKEYTLYKSDSLLTPKGQRYTAVRPSDSIALICYQDPARKKV